MLERMRRVAKRIVALSATEWADLARAQLALIAAEWIVRRRPIGSLIESATTASAPSAGGSAPDPVAARLALAVSRAADYGVFRPLCLVRALALQQMLEARGIHGSRIRLGVRRKNGGLAAHAWVEHGDAILGDSEDHVGAYSRLGDVRVIERP